MNDKEIVGVAIKTLVIDQTLNDAEELLNTLRNADIAVHATSVTNKPALFDALKSEKCDLILLSTEVEDGDFSDMLKICRTYKPGTSLLIIHGNQNRDTLINTMQEGARDIISRKDQEHLQLAAKREITDLLTRIKLEDTQLKLNEAEERCTSLIDSSRDAIAYIHEGMHIFANQTYLEIFGYVDMDDIEGLPILDMVVSEQHKAFKSFLRGLGDENSQFETLCLGSDQKPFDAKLEFSPASIDGEPCVQVIIRDRSKDKELEQKMRLLSNQDMQTGLANRQYFLEQLQEIVENRDKNNKDGSLLIVIIDDFRSIRTRIGIAAGDNLLKKVAEILTNITEEDKFLARFGDHSFTLYLPHARDEKAMELAEQIRKAIEDEVYKNQEELVHPTCSIGLTYLNTEISSGQKLLDQAYVACDAVRNEGGNAVSVFDPSKQSVELEEVDRESEAEIEKLIEHALENDSFHLVYQPVVSLQGDSRENYAVLIRLHDNNNQEIQLNNFMKQAEQSNLMAEIDRWVIRYTIDELAQQREQQRKVNFMISLSSATLVDDSILLWIIDCLREKKMQGAWLTFQIKDIDLRAHSKEAKKLIDGLKKIKCQIAISQFGLQPKSESILKNFQVDFVKFDSSFIEDLASSQEKQDQLNALNNMAQSYDTKTVAMAVEDANSLAVLWTVGVNYIQGYFLQEPSETISYEFGPT